MSEQFPPPPPPGDSGTPAGPPSGAFAYNGGQWPVPPAAVSNNMVFAVLTTIFCCLPFGIVAIVNAAQVNRKLAMNDYHGAVASAAQARTWSIVSLVAGVVVGGLYFLIAVILGAAASTGY